MPAITSDSFRKIRLESNAGAVQGIIAADQQLDTLTLVAGTGITITPDENLDKIVIGVVGTVNTAGLNDILYNGNTSTYGMTVADITVDNLKINNDSVYIDHVTANLTLGVTGTGVVNVTNDLQTRHVLPATDILYDLGSPTKRFRDIYLSGSTIYIGDATISSNGTAIDLPTGTTIGSVDLTDSIVPSQTNQVDKFLRTNGTSLYWDVIPSQFPDQTGATGKFLKSNGTIVSWDNIPSTDLTGYATESYVTGALGGYATQTYVGTAISNLVESAPETLNTLNELAAALGDDTNFATTVSTAIGLKAPINSPTFTGSTVYFNGSDNIAEVRIGPHGVGFENTADVPNAIFGLKLKLFGGVVAMSVDNDKFKFNKAIDFLPYGPSNTPTVALDYENFTVNTTANLKQTSEVLNLTESPSSVVNYNFLTGSIWYNYGINGNWTANFTNLPTIDNRTLVCTLVIFQSSLPGLPTEVQIDGNAVQIFWLGGTVPTAGTVDTIDIISLTFIRAFDGWDKVLGSITSYEAAV